MISSNFFSKFWCLGSKCLKILVFHVKLLGFQVIIDEMLTETTLKIIVKHILNKKINYQ